MKVSNWLRRSSLGTVALMAALAFSGCSDQQGSVEQLLGPDAADFARGGNKGENKAENKGGKEARGWGKGGKGANDQIVAESGTGNSWRLATQSVRKGETKAEAVIGAEGGYLYSGNHILWVPQGAVDLPTEFKIQVFAPISADSAVAGVSLKAVRISETGDTINVGKAGFLKPVILAVSYADTDVTDPEATRLLWIKEPGVVEQVPNQYLHADKKWVVGYLDHFSEYGIGWPNLLRAVTGLLF